LYGSIIPGKSTELKQFLTQRFSCLDGKKKNVYTGIFLLVMWEMVTWWHS